MNELGGAGRIDVEIIADIDAAFGGAVKPEHFTNYDHCEECAEHDQLLRQRDRATLKIEDVGDPCWSPIVFTSPEGIAYYMPALVRLSLSPPTYGYDWFGDQLLFHLSYNDADNGFLRFCDARQRRAVAALLEYLMIVGADREDRLSDLDEFSHAREFWSSV